MDTKFQELIYRLFANPDSQLVEAFLTESKRHGVDFRRNFQVEELRKNHIPDSNAESIHITGVRLENLKILESQYFPNLIGVRLHQCALEDISSLASLYAPNLKVLNMGANKISKVISGDYLDKLTMLYLDHNQIREISVLNQCQNLQRLTLDHNPLDTSSLDFSNLASLTRLSLVYIGIEKLADVRFPKMLTQLFLSDNEIKDISKVIDLENLESIFLEKNHIKDFSPLFSLKRLQYANIRGNRITKKNAEKLKEHLPENCVLIT